MKEDRDRCEAILKSTMIRIGRRIKERREDKGFDYLELVIRSRVNQQTIYEIESGICCNPTLKTLINLADALGMDIIEMLNS